MKRATYTQESNLRFRAMTDGDLFSLAVVSLMSSQTFDAALKMKSNIAFVMLSFSA